MFYKWTSYTAVTAAIVMVIHGGGLSGTGEDHIQAEKLTDLARVGEVINPLLSGENDVSICQKSERLENEDVWKLTLQELDLQMYSPLWLRVLCKREP